MRTELGWGPTVDFEHGLADTIAWYAEHRHWWQPLRARAAIDENGWRGTRNG